MSKSKLITLFFMILTKGLLAQNFPVNTSLSSYGTVELHVNDLNFFRNATLSANTIFSYSHTVPLLISLKSSNNHFIFTNGNNRMLSPITHINLVQARAIAPIQSVAISISDYFQEIYSGDGSLGKDNKMHSRVVGQFSITAANLKAGFLRKGTYSNSLNVEIKDWRGVDLKAILDRQLNLKVIVNDLAELTINQTNVDFLFDHALKYEKGISIHIPNHLSVSKTTPFDITVKTSGANFTNGIHAIPISVLEIGFGDGQDWNNTISALSTTGQTLIGNASPTVDRNINVRYMIPAEQTQNLLNKGSGTYTANIVYTLTAH